MLSFLLFFSLTSVTARRLYFYFYFQFSIFLSLSYLSYVQGSFLCVGKKKHLTGCYVVYYPCLPLSQREKKYGKNRGREEEEKKTLRFGILVFDVCFISAPIGCGFASAHGSPRFRRYYWCREVCDAGGGVR